MDTNIKITADTRDAINSVDKLTDSLDENTKAQKDNAKETEKVGLSYKELQRQYKQLRNELATLTPGTEEYNRKLVETANCQHDLREITEQVSMASQDFGDRLGTVSKAMAGVAGAVNVGVSALSLFGVEDEKVKQKITGTITAVTGRVTGRSAIYRGITAVKGLATSFKTVTDNAKLMTKATNLQTTAQKQENVATKQGVIDAKAMGGAMQAEAAATGVATAATKTFKATLISTGIGALVVAIASAIAALVSGIGKWIEKNKEAKQSMADLKGHSDAYKESMQDAAKATAETREKLFSMRNEYNKLGNDMQKKKKYIEDNKDEFEAMGLAIDDVNKAETFMNGKGLENFIKAEQAKNEYLAINNRLLQERINLSVMESDIQYYKDIQNDSSSAKGEKKDARKQLKELEKDVKRQNNLINGLQTQSDKAAAAVEKTAKTVNEYVKTTSKNTVDTTKKTVDAIKESTKTLSDDFKEKTGKLSGYLSKMKSDAERLKDYYTIMIDVYKGNLSKDFMSDYEKYNFIAGPSTFGDKFNQGMIEVWENTITTNSHLVEAYTEEIAKTTEKGAEFIRETLKKFFDELYGNEALRKNMGMSENEWKTYVDERKKFNQRFIDGILGMDMTTVGGLRGAITERKAVLDNVIGRISMDMVAYLKEKKPEVLEKIEKDSGKPITETILLDQLYNKDLGEGGRWVHQFIKDMEGYDSSIINFIQSMILERKQIAEQGKANKLKLEQDKVNLREEKRLYEERLRLQNEVNVKMLKSSEERIAIFKKETEKLSNDGPFSGIRNWFLASSEEQFNMRKRTTEIMKQFYDAINEYNRNEELYKAEEAQLVAFSNAMIITKDEFNKKMDELEQKRFDNKIARLEAEATKEEAMYQLSLEHVRKYVEAYSQISGSVSSIIGTVSDGLEKGTSEWKNLKKAQVLIDTLSGATTAFMSAQELGPIAGPIVGAANMAAVMTTGYANWKEIDKTNVSKNSNNSWSNSWSVRGSALQSATYDYNQQQTNAGLADIRNQIQDVRVYVTTNDIERGLNTRRTQVSNNSF